MSKSIANNAVYLYDMCGKLLLKQKLLKESIQEIKFNKHISAGSYLLQIIKDKNV